VAHVQHIKTTIREHNASTFIAAGFDPRQQFAQLQHSRLIFHVY
jgi:hypothetical protein